MRKREKVKEMDGMERGNKEIDRNEKERESDKEGRDQGAS